MNSKAAKDEKPNDFFQKQFEDVAQYYDELEAVPYSLHKMIFDSIPTNHHTYLDLGCGTGRLLEMVAPAFHLSTGLDFSRNMIEIAKKRTNGKTQFVCCSIDQMEFGEGSFDYVTCTGVLHHLHNDPKSLNKTLFKMKRILKPGGRLIIADFVTPRVVRNRVDWLYYIAPVLKSLKNRDINIFMEAKGRPRIFREHMAAERGMLFTRKAFYKTFGGVFEDSGISTLSKKRTIVKLYYLIWDKPLS